MIKGWVSKRRQVFDTAGDLASVTEGCQLSVHDVVPSRRCHRVRRLRANRRSADFDFLPLAFLYGLRKEKITACHVYYNAPFSFCVPVADIPGLIEGAHLNRGLGYSFLRHVERCPGILYVVDLASRCDPAVQLTTLWDELDRFETGLSRRPNIILGNKIDIPGADRRAADLQEFLNGCQDRGYKRFLTISAKRRINIEALLRTIRELYEQQREMRTS